MAKIIAHVKDGDFVVASRSFVGDKMGDVRAKAETWAAAKYLAMKGQGRDVDSYSTRVVL